MGIVPIAVTDALGWLVVGLFGLAAVLAPQRRSGDLAGVLAWGLFGLFWALLIPRFALQMHSPIETVLAIVAVPACLYAGYLFWVDRETILVLTRAIAVMGLVYLPFETIPGLQERAIETVAHQTYLVISGLGYDVSLQTGPVNGYTSELAFVQAGHTYKTHIVLACTGLGSMAIFTGLIAAIHASPIRKLGAAIAAIGIIYVLNIVRNVFITIAFGLQWFQVFTEQITWLLGYTDPRLVSYFVADRLISQSLSVVTLAGIAVLVVSILPELRSVLEDTIYVVTRTELDLDRVVSPDDG